MSSAETVCGDTLITNDIERRIFKLENQMAFFQYRMRFNKGRVVDHVCGKPSQPNGGEWMLPKSLLTKRSPENG